MTRRDVFRDIANRYDLINTLLSFGQDVSWRQRGIDRLPPGKVIDLGAGVLVNLSARIADGIAVWGAFSGVARAVSATLASPATVAALAAAALISAVALRALHTLMLPERNVRHAQSH